MDTFKNIARKLKELSTNPAPNYKPVNRANNKVIDAVTENFWPNIRKHILADDSNTQPMKAICSVCWDELHVACITSPEDKLPIGLVAPCGHTMCPACWPRKISDPSHTLFEECRKCPVCETLLECFICRKACDKKVIPALGGKAAIGLLPKTAPECGREYRPYCKDCAKPYHGKGDGFWFDNPEERESVYRS